jgi:hypothetical protein
MRLAVLPVTARLAVGWHLAGPRRFRIAAGRPIPAGLAVPFTRRLACRTPAPSLLAPLPSGRRRPQRISPGASRLAGYACSRGRHAGPAATRRSSSAISSGPSTVMSPAPMVTTTSPGTASSASRAGTFSHDGS